MHIGTTAVYDLQERGASSKADAIRRLKGENERQTTPRFDVFDFVFTGQGPHMSFSQDWLEDVWSAQVVASWLTDWGIWKKTFPEQEGMVSAQGFNIADVRPLSPQANGRVTLDLSTVLRPVYTVGDGIIQGPDGIYGPSTDSMMAEYARTGKAFGKSIPESVRPVFDRILNSVRTRAIKEGLAQRSSGDTVPKESAAAMVSASVSGDAQINAGMIQTKPSRSLGQTFASLSFTGTKTLDPQLIARIAKVSAVPVSTALLRTPSAESVTSADAPASVANAGVLAPQAQAAEDSAALYWVLGGLAVTVALGGAAYYLYTKDR